MAAPTTARSTPVGVALRDGHSSKIAFQADPDVSFWEKSVKPPGIDGGDPIETSTMHNTTWRTMAPRSLRTATPLTVVAAYDPRVFDQIVALVNVETGITVHFSDGSTLDFYGFLQNFEPNELAEGTHPEATITITPTNTHPTSGAEVAPNYKTASGTD